MSIYYNREQRVTSVILFCTKIQDNVLALKENLIIALILRMNTLHLLWGYITKWQQHTEWQYIGPHKKEFCELTHGSWHGLKLLIIQNKNQTIIYFSADNKAEHLLWHLQYARKQPVDLCICCIHPSSRTSGQQIMYSLHQRWLLPN